jgi:hypothetical protein
VARFACFASSISCGGIRKARAKRARRIWGASPEDCSILRQIAQYGDGFVVFFFFFPCFSRFGVPLGSYYGLFYVFNVFIAWFFFVSLFELLGWFANENEQPTCEADCYLLFLLVILLSFIVGSLLRSDGLCDSFTSVGKIDPRRQTKTTWGDEAHSLLLVFLFTTIG